jgi:Mitochondrial carrier protein
MHETDSTYFSLLSNTILFIYKLLEKMSSLRLFKNHRLSYLASLLICIIALPSASSNTYHHFGIVRSVTTPSSSSSSSTTTRQRRSSWTTTPTQQQQYSSVPLRQEEDDAEAAAFGFLDKNDDNIAEFSFYKKNEDNILNNNNDNGIHAVLPCQRSLPSVLARGALLRIASDLSGGTPLENIKTRVTVTKENMWQSCCHIYRTSGMAGFWTGSSSRSVEGALIGAIFMLGSTLTKARLKSLGAPPTVAALGGGLVGGVAQAFIMTPAGMVFTSLNVNRGKNGFEKDTTWSVTSRIIKEKGFMGMYYGFNPMALRQASNWASRAGFTEIARSVLNLQQYGILGEIASGTLGGVGSCWNTPIETIRVVTQRDLSTGVPTKTMGGYWNDIVEKDGMGGLFRGLTPRAIQAVWQTCFLVVVPNMMGL